ncbi:MAG TPA: hypothetical protein VNS10_08100 [Gemmatimonadaceae bacterium]|jgi:hypothetical protein|nr:hypothetical protein [Gemmatimonadaceae bacterium]
MTRAMVVGVCAAVAACASSGGTPSPSSAPTTMETTRIAAGTGTMTMTTNRDIATNAKTVAYGMDGVWAAVRAAYDSVAVPVAIFDAASHSVGNSALRVRRRLGDVALSKYLNCGSTQGFPSADTYEIQMSVLTQLRSDPASGGTTILTTVQGQGRPMTISSEFTPCSSTGGLETRIIDLVTRALRR